MICFKPNVILRCVRLFGARLEGWLRKKLGIFIYMLRCADGSFYVGSTTGEDLSPRIEQHHAGSFGGYTASRRPVVLVWSQYFDRITDGIAAERQVKGWSRAKKEALIADDWECIERLSTRRGGKPLRPILRGSAKTPSASG